MTSDFTARGKSGPLAERDSGPDFGSPRGNSSLDVILIFKLRQQIQKIAIVAPFKWPTEKRRGLRPGPARRRPRAQLLLPVNLYYTLWLRYPYPIRLRLPMKTDISTHQCTSAIKGPRQERSAWLQTSMLNIAIFTYPTLRISGRGSWHCRAPWLNEC